MVTRDAIRIKFMRIYERERVDRITVKGLCAAVPAARTTFYARYRNVDDVLAKVEGGLLGGLAEVTERVSSGDVPQMDFGLLLGETFGFIKANWAGFHAQLFPTARMRPNWDLLAEMAAFAGVEGAKHLVGRAPEGVMTSI